MIIFKMKIFLLCLVSLFCVSAFGQKQVVFQSKNLPKPDTTWVFTPKKISKGQKFPAVILLHGWSGNYKQWNNIMDAQKYADEYGYILICPDGLFDSWYLNSPVMPQSQYESFFFDELLPKMKTDYPIDSNHVFITGLSMGGHGALWLFLKHPEMFKSAGSTSGGINLRDAYGKYGASALLGNPARDSEIWDKYAVTGNIDKLAGTNKEIIFDCGADDFFYQSNNKLKQKCDSLKIQATYISQPGAHNAAYWKKSIKQQFEFFQKQIIKSKTP